MIAADNTRRLAGGRTIAKRYADIAAPRRADNRTGDAIAADVLRRLQGVGLTITA